MAGSPFAEKEKALFKRNGYGFTARILATNESASQGEIHSKFARTHFLDIQGILSYPEIIEVGCEITANMLGKRTFPGLEPG